MSYVIPELICNSCHARRMVITHQEGFKRWRQTERGRKEGGVFSVIDRAAQEIQQCKCKFNQLSSEEVWLSVFEGSLLLITPVVLYDNIYK